MRDKQYNVCMPRSFLRASFYTFYTIHRDVRGKKSGNKNKNIFYQTPDTQTEPRDRWYAYTHRAQIDCRYSSFLLFIGKNRSNNFLNKNPVQAENYTEPRQCSYRETQNRHSNLIK
jgi:hypothetical protein